MVFTETTLAWRMKISVHMNIHLLLASSQAGQHQHIEREEGKGCTCYLPGHYEVPEELKGRRPTQWNRRAAADPLDGWFPASSRCQCPLWWPLRCTAPRKPHWSSAWECGSQWILGNLVSIWQSSRACKFWNRQASSRVTKSSNIDNTDSTGVVSIQDRQVLCSDRCVTVCCFKACVPFVWAKLVEWHNRVAIQRFVLKGNPLC